MGWKAAETFLEQVKTQVTFEGQEDIIQPGVMGKGIWKYYMFWDTWGSELDIVQ